METISTKDGVNLYYKDWGQGQPIVFHHGWPLSSDDWDTQMLFFLQHGFRVVAFDRRGHGRSSQVAEGHDMDHYAADADAVVEHLDLRNAVHIGHSTGGGVVARYVARHGKGRVAKADRREVAEALRPTLEAFMRVAYPQHFTPGFLLGPFRGLCEQRVSTPNEILDRTL